MLQITSSGGDPRSLSLAGELDLATTPQLLDSAQELVDGDGDVTLVLTEVSFIDSQGIRAFIQIARALEDRGMLLLARPSPEVRKLFDIVRVADFPNIGIVD
jgi:anti-anti-sigma factor